LGARGIPLPFWTLYRRALKGGVAWAERYIAARANSMGMFQCTECHAIAPEGDRRGWIDGEGDDPRDICAPCFREIEVRDDA